jgi:hypothetical protein
VLLIDDSQALFHASHRIYPTRMLMLLTVYCFEKSEAETGWCAWNGTHLDEACIHQKVSGSRHVILTKTKVSSYWRFVRPDTIRA